MDCTLLLQRHAKACELTQPLDRGRAEASLHAWLAAIGAPKCGIHLVVDSAGAARAARDAWDARDAGAARDVWDARDAGAAWDAWGAWDARAARDAWDARAARAARDAGDARDAGAAWDAWGAWDARAARDALDALDARAARDAGAARAAWAAWDASYTSIIAIGAESLSDRKTSQKWMPFFDALEAGVHLVWIGEKDVYYSAPPEQTIVDNQRRLHNEHAPAFVWLADVKLYFWHGVLVPPAWITDKQSLTAADALGQTNVELRRAACEIVGWDNTLDQLKARTIERDEDPTIGELVEVSLPDAGREKFLRVTCGTGRRFAIPVPPNMETALQANAWTFGFDDVTDFTKPGVRT